MNKPNEEIKALVKIYDFIKWIIPVLEKFPRTQKFLLADRIEVLLLDILELVIEAVYTKERMPILKKANIILEKARYLIRLSFDMKYINNRKYEYCINLLLEIGREIGGWIKYTQNKNV